MTFVKRLILILLTLFGVMSLSGVMSAASADSAPIYTSWKNNLAVGGYDVVSFHTGKPLKGRSDYILAYQGAIWQFSSQNNMDTFRGNPERYVPQYGGYCAWALAKGKLAKGSPDAWHMEDGKLYLNFNERIARRWKKKRPVFIEQADARWPAILND